MFVIVQDFVLFQLRLTFSTVQLGLYRIDMNAAVTKPNNIIIIIVYRGR